MVDSSKIIEDNIEDNVFEILKEIRRIPGWKKNKKLLKEELFRRLTQEKYILFWASNQRTYLINHVGESYLYDVPIHLGGHLKVFRGRRVRIICTGSGKHHWRQIAVGLIKKGDLEI